MTSHDARRFGRLPEGTGTRLRNRGRSCAFREEWTMSISMPASNNRMNARAWGVLFVLAGAVFLEGIDVAMLNVALPSIRTDLGLSTGMRSGVVSAYVLGYG